MKKIAKTTIFLLTFLTITIVAVQSVNLAVANPYFRGGFTSPPKGTQPPIITVFSPNNNLYSSNNISFAFNTTISKDTYLLTDIYYEIDWQEDNITVLDLDMSTPNYDFVKEVSYNQTLTNIPDGNHTIKIIAVADGYYVKTLEWTAYDFSITGTSSMKFTVDTTSPHISILNPQNRVYDISNVSLNFQTNEPVTQTSYVLDGQNNCTITENIMMQNLSNGLHNVTVYATDFAGNVGSSETSFTVDKPEPFPVMPVTAAVCVVVAVVAALSTVIYVRKRKYEVESP